MVQKENSNCSLIVNRWCLGWYIVAMLLLIGPMRDGKYNTFICRGSYRQSNHSVQMPSILSQMSWRSSVTSFSTVGVRLVALMSRIERKYFLISTSYIHIWQGYLTSSYYSIFHRIVCVLWTFYQWGHFVMLIIRKFNLLAFNPGHFFLVDI